MKRLKECEGMELSIRPRKRNVVSLCLSDLWEGRSRPVEHDSVRSHGEFNSIGVHTACDRIHRDFDQTNVHQIACLLL